MSRAWKRNAMGIKRWHMREMRMKEMENKKDGE
jgi:hypothetical protein